MSQQGPTPIIVLGDAPNIQGGLARIARDVTRLIWEGSELEADAGQLGWGWDGEPFPWRVYPILDQAGWADQDILQVLDWHAQERKPTVVLTIWDPSRCWHVSHRLQQLRARGLVKLWGYFPFDSENDQGAIGGPAAEALRGYDKVLAYGKYGAGVIAKTLGKKVEEVPWLPHGIGDEWQPVSRDEAARRLAQTGPFKLDPRAPLLGCVAANQPRKDLGLFFRAAQIVRSQVPDLRIWLHVDQLVVEGRDNSWAVPELVEIYGFNAPEHLLTFKLEDEDLAALYSLCGATVAPGLGEGFGYPIAESQACGTPVIHGDFAGGPELISEKRWLVAPAATRLDGPYALQRPIFSADDFALRIIEALEWKRTEPEACAAYCAGAVEHLRWRHLRARWVGLFKDWLREIREGEAQQ